MKERSTGREFKLGGWGAHGVLITCSVAPGVPSSWARSRMRWGGGAEGLRSALVIVCFAGFVAAFVEWLRSRTYAADMGKLRAVTLEAE